MRPRPGAKGVYCSIDPNLALGVLGRATGESARRFDRLLGEPLRSRPTDGRSVRPATYGGGGVCSSCRAIS